MIYRYKGAKGVLTKNNQLSDSKIVFRESMIKFNDPIID